MNDYLLAVFLGVIEGLTEFLPISSTAHLRIAEHLLGLALNDEFWKMFSIIIQLGAILSVVFYFSGRIKTFLSSFRPVPTHPVSLVLIAFVVTAVPAFLMSKIIGLHLESLRIIGASLLIGGVIMILVDRFFPNGHIKQVEEMKLSHAIWIGVCQIASAVFPGTSRSMSTIAAGQLVGLSRSAALEFSFFLSIPTMAAATLYDLLKSIRHGLTIDAHGWTIIAIGFITSFFVAWAVIAWFLSWVKTRGFLPFGLYRMVLGLLILLQLAL